MNLMNTLPPKPEDTLPPRSSRGVSPRASSMRVHRDNDRDRDGRRSPRRASPNWRRPSRNDDRYQSWSPRDRDDRWPRPHDRGRPREYRRSRSRSRSRSPRYRRDSRRSRSRSRSRSGSRSHHHYRRTSEKPRREPSRVRSRSPRRSPIDPPKPQKQEISTQNKGAQEPPELRKLEIPSHRVIHPLPPTPQPPIGPSYKSPAIPTEPKSSREKESRIREGDNTRFSNPNSRRHTQDSRSHSRSRSRSKSPRSNTRSRQSTPGFHLAHNSRKVPNIDDFLSQVPAATRDPKFVEFNAEVQRFNAQRLKLENDHANSLRAARRAQHELELAMLELKSAEERRKAADRVHETIAKGCTVFAT